MMRFLRHPAGSLALLYLMVFFAGCTSQQRAPSPPPLLRVPPYTAPPPMVAPAPRPPSPRCMSPLCLAAPTDEAGTAKEKAIRAAEARVFAEHPAVWKRYLKAYEDTLLGNRADQEAVEVLHRLYQDLRDAAKDGRPRSEAERMAEIEWKWIDPVPSGDFAGKGKPDELWIVPLDSLSAKTMLPHFVDQSSDTLADIAEMYGSTVEWITAANPKVKNDADLRRVKEIQVPVPVDDLQASPGRATVACLRFAPPNARYVVQPNDTIWTLMARFGLTLADIARHNPGLKEFQPGQVLALYLPPDQLPDFRPELVATDPVTKEAVPLPLKHTDIKAQVAAYVARVQMQQQYENPYAVKIEATYVFPLPHDAAVTDFVMTIGDRKIRGLIREREEAKRIYEEAKQQGYRASLLTEERPNIFTQKVANLEPGKRIDIDLVFFSTLKYADGEFELALPTVVGPRFNPPGYTKGVDAVPRGTAPSSTQATVVEYLAPNERSGHEISIQVDVDAGVPVEKVASPSHQIETSRTNDRQFTVKLKANDTIPNKDFVLRYAVAGKALKTAFLCDRTDQGNAFSLLLLPPRELTDVPRQPREMIFVVDRSGSMNGRPLEKVKDAMRRCLRGLDERDAFQVISFSESASALGPGPVVATKANVERGLDYVDSLDSAGGTMMLEGIKAALDMPHDPERLRIVSFMTDGYIGNEDEILAAVKAKLGSARIFSFGVGTSVNRYLIEGLATVGNGAAAFVSLDEGSSPAVDKFYEQVKHAALVDVALDWHGLAVTDVFPKRLPDLLVGRPVVICGRFTGALPPAITVSGMAGGKRVSFDVAVPAAEGTVRREGIGFVWARQKLAELSLANIVKPAKELQDEMIRFSTATSVLCELTAFLAVDSSAPTAGNAGVSVAVPVPVPAGVKYETTVRP